MVTLVQAKKLYPNAETYRPGDSAALNVEILRLVRAGQKTVTCASWVHFEDGTEALPVEGRIDIALAWNNSPAYAVETLKVESIRFCDMTEDRVAAQGEFGDLEDWRNGYREYLTRVGQFHPEMKLMVETFKMVQDFGGSSDV
ncbi:MAG: ASCH domain-containing protein [Paracoccaceae bacterium]